MTDPTNHPTPDPHPWYRVAMVDAQGGRFFAGFASAETEAEAIQTMRKMHGSGQGHARDFTFYIDRRFEPLTDHWHELERNA